MNKIISKISHIKCLLIICLLFANNIFCADGQDIKFRQITFPAGTDRFVASRSYVMGFLGESNPNIIKIANIFCDLLGEQNEPILEDDRGTMECGYSFPPHMGIQLPFLQLCSRLHPIVLDVGAGSGNDSIMALLAGARRVIAVDIHKKQLSACKERVTRILSGFPELEKFANMEKDFSVAGNVPTSYVGQIQVINANRVMHFMDETETATFLTNAHSMLVDSGYLFITVSMPTQAHETQGVVYYSTTTVQGGKPSFARVTKEESMLRSPRFKKEVTRESGSVTEVIMYQGRHLHTPETLRSYFGPLFRIVDLTTINCGPGDDFISVIARKVPAPR